MLYYFDKDTIRKNQAFKKIEKRSFGAWGSNAFNQRVIEEVTLKNVYEHVSFECTMFLYFNNVQIDVDFSTWNDFYGFGTSLLNGQESIDFMVKKYNLTENDKLDCRIEARKVKRYYYFDMGVFRDVPSTWFLSFEDSQAFYSLGDERFDKSVSGKYNMKTTHSEGEYFTIHSTLKDGFTIDRNKIDGILKEVIEEEELTISEEDIKLA